MVAWREETRSGRNIWRGARSRLGLLRRPFGRVVGWELGGRRETDLVRCSEERIGAVGRGGRTADAGPRRAVGGSSGCGGRVSSSRAAQLSLSLPGPLGLVRLLSGSVLVMDLDGCGLPGCGWNKQSVRCGYLALGPRRNSTTCVIASFPSASTFSSTPSRSDLSYIKKR